MKTNFLCVIDEEGDNYMDGFTSYKEAELYRRNLQEKLGEVSAVIILCEESEEGVVLAETVLSGLNEEGVTRLLNEANITIE